MDLVGGVLVIDLETTGLFKNHVEEVNDGPIQPRVVEIAWTLFTQDGEVMAQHQTLVNSVPVIPATASAVHRLDGPTLGRWGVTPETAMHSFLVALAKASQWVAYGDFERRMMKRECLMTGNGQGPLERPRLRYVDVQQVVADLYCDGKWIKMSEAHLKVTGDVYESYHRAGPDRDALARMYWCLREAKKL